MAQTAPLDLESILASPRLPSLPHVATRVLELASSRDPDLLALIETIKLDPAISGKLLKTANSALFGLRRRASSIEAAVPLLGASLVRTLVLSFSLANCRRPPRNVLWRYQQWWRRVITQAVIAESLAEYAQADPAEWFLAGLLQDVGTLVLMEVAPELIAAGSDTSFEDDSDSLGGETGLFGLTHVEVSVALCTSWGLAIEVVEGISRHHELPAPVPMTNLAPADALAAALWIAHSGSQWMLDAPLSGGARTQTWFRRLQQLTSQSEGDLADWIRENQMRATEMAALLDIDLGDTPDLDTLLNQAQEALAELAVASEMEMRRAEQRADQAESKLTHLEQENREFEQQAHLDALTGAFNRRFLDQLLPAELHRCQTSGMPLGVLFVDLDRFKQLNDRFGHVTGDCALRKVAEVLQNNVRDTDRVVRYGGDEFLVLLVRISAEMLRKVAQRVLYEVTQTDLPSLPQGTLSCSVGALHYHSDATAEYSAPMLIRDVDQCMYAAKQAGGNQLRFQATATLLGTSADS